MSASSKRKKNLWYGYLEAGANSSPVIRDDGLNTGNPKTVYLFNLARGCILEYSREIVEPKLRGPASPSWRPASLKRGATSRTGAPGF